MGWQAEVCINDWWGTNKLVFATKAEALGYGRNLKARWTLVTDLRTIEVEAEPTHEWSDKQGLGAVGGPKTLPTWKANLLR